MKSSPFFSSHKTEPKIVESIIYKMALVVVFIGNVGSFTFFVGWILFWILPILFWVREPISTSFTTTTELRRSMNTEYFDATMINENINPCQDYHGFTCDGTPEYQRGVTNQLNFILSRANETITVHPDEMSSLLNQNIGMIVNMNMNIMYYSCLSHIPVDVTPDNIMTMKVCNSRSTGRIIKLIDSIENVGDLSKIIGVLLGCGNIKILPFSLTKVRPPFALRTRLNNQREDVVWIQHNKNIHGDDRELGVVESTLKIILENTNERYNSVCLDFRGDGMLSKIRIPDLLHKYRHDNVRFVCFSSKTFFTRLFQHMTSNVEDWKEYMKHMIIRSVHNTLLSLNKVNMKSECLDIVVNRFPTSYCMLTKSLLYNGDRILWSIGNFSRLLITNFTDKIVANPTKYGLTCDGTVVNNIADNLRLVNVNVVGCANSEIAEERFRKYEVGPNLNPDEFIGNIFMTNREPDTRFLANVMDVLTESSPSYSIEFHEILIPFNSMIEPKYSIIYDDTSKMGTIGFAMFHEMTHALIDITEWTTNGGGGCDRHTIFNKILGNNGMTEHQLLNEEKVCDIISAEMIVEMTTGDDDKSRVLEVAAQYICNEVEWRFSGESGDGHQNPKSRVNGLVNMMNQTKTMFKSKYSCD